MLQVRFIGMGMQEVTAYPDKFITITLQEEVSENGRGGCGGLPVGASRAYDG